MEAGFDADKFWRQTPRLFHLQVEAKGKVIEREKYDRAWQARTTAVLIRLSKKVPFPTVEQLVGVKPIVRKMSSAEVKGVFASMRDEASAAG